MLASIALFSTILIAKLTSALPASHLLARQDTEDPPCGVWRPYIYTPSIWNVGQVVCLVW